MIKAEIDPSQKRHSAEVYYLAMKRFSDQTRVNNQYSTKVYNKTSKFIFFVSMIAAISMLYLVMLETDLEDAMASLKKDMVEMYEYFGEMSYNVDRMNISVKHMRDDVTVMPRIAENMVLMSTNITKMTRNIDAMQLNVTQMQGSMSIIKTDMNQMGVNFTRMTANVNNMSYNINQMSRPMKYFP